MSDFSWIVKCGDIVERRFADGRKPQRLDRAPRVKVFGPSGGVWQRSRSNGIIGTKETLRKAQELDAKLGVPIDYQMVKKRGKMAVYTANYESKRQKNNWLRARKRVDLDAGYGDPCPGDFRGNVPPEFER